MPQDGDSPDPGAVAQRDQEHAEALQWLREARAYGLVVMPQGGGIQACGAATGDREMRCIAVGFSLLLGPITGAEYEELVRQGRAMVEYDERAERLRRLGENEEAEAA